MAKNQSELYHDVLDSLAKAKVLDHVILIGSWCGQLYKDYFKGKRYTPIIRTRDVDFLVPLPPTFSKKVDLQQVFDSLGFNIVFAGRKGYIRFEHPDLIIEFLVPERGRGSEKPYPLPKLGINAQPLRYLDLLADKTVRIRHQSVDIVAPHPANFAVHKLIISQRRKNPDKRAKDRALAIEVLVALVAADEDDAVLRIYQTIPKKWQKLVDQALAAGPCPDEVTALFSH